MSDYRELAKQLADDRLDYLQRRPMNIDEVTMRCVKASAAIMELLHDRVSTNIFDEEETHTNCTVQVLRNSVTGEVSVGWFRNKEQEDDLK